MAADPNHMNGNHGTAMLSNPIILQNAQRLLDFNNKLDISLLDSIINELYNGMGENLNNAQKILTTFKEHPDAWTRILENVIKTRWKVLPGEQTESIKKFIVSLIIKTSTNALDCEKVYLNKLNMVLVQILKQDWPKRWPNFISDICGSSKKSEILCINNMIILKLLSEELFDFSSGQLTQAKSKHLKDSMCQQFREIFTLCQHVLESSRNEKLILCTLETLLKFINWIPLGYIFETGLFNPLIYKFFPYYLFRNVTLNILTEVASIDTDQYDSVYLIMFTSFVSQLKLTVPLTCDMNAYYKSANPTDQIFIQNLNLFLSTLLKKRGKLYEKEEHRESLLHAIHYLILISQVDEIEVFKVSLEYWGALAEDLYNECPLDDRLLNRNSPNPTYLRRNLYEESLSKVRFIMIGRMAKPEEVLVVENEQGDVVREFMRDTDMINLYNTMRQCLVFLTNLNAFDTENIMNEKLKRQVDGSEWSWKNLNTLCWAIGSISGAMLEEEERKFLVTVIKELLGLCEQKRGKENKAIIASNIMYVVGQYPRFLRAHWKFLKTVVNKLFEFMHETHEGVQDMACDTFIKIATKCKRHFITYQTGEEEPFIYDILRGMATYINQLTPQQIATFYEAVGIMIAAELNVETQEELIKRYMELPNQTWTDLIRRASFNVDVLTDENVVKQLDNILKTNYRACKALGFKYVTQLKIIYLDMLCLYKAMSENITNAISQNSANFCNTLVKQMRGVKKNILKLINQWFTDAEAGPVICLSFVPKLLDAILLDYKLCKTPAAREPEVLSTMATVVGRLQDEITSQIPAIFDGVFECTLEMINKDYEEFPEHRVNFYNLLHEVVLYCFPSLLTLSGPKFKFILDSIIWAFKHSMRNVAETGLRILLILFQKMADQPTEISSKFFQTYYTDILEHLFSVTTDTSHHAGLALQSEILAYMFSLVEMGKINAPLNPNNPDPATNPQYVLEFVSNLLKFAFSHLTDAQIKIIVKGFFNLDQDPQAFKEHLRDFLVQIREYSGQDNADLFLEEREKELMAKEWEKREKMLAIPGMIKPHDNPNEEMDA